MIAVKDRRDGWVGPSPDPHGLRASLWLEQHFFIESEMALFSECRLKCAQNLVDRADIVREAIYRKLTMFSLQDFKKRFVLFI